MHPSMPPFAVGAAAFSPATVRTRAVLVCVAFGRAPDGVLITSTAQVERAIRASLAPCRYAVLGTHRQDERTWALLWLEVPDEPAHPAGPVDAVMAGRFYAWTPLFLTDPAPLPHDYWEGVPSRL